MKVLYFISLLFFSLSSFSQTLEVCGDNTDNDLDYLTDCADPDCNDGNCSNHFPCTDNARLFQTRFQGGFDDQLLEWNGNTWEPVVGWSNPENIVVNAIGYNVQDGFLYGVTPISSAVNSQLQVCNLVRITSTGLELIPLPDLTVKSWHTGDMDLCGNLYISGRNFGVMAVINVNTLSVTEFSFSGITIPDVADWTYIPATGLLYGVRNSAPNLLRAIDLQGNFINDYTVTNFPASGGSGAMFGDRFGNIYCFVNSTGILHLIAPDVPNDFTAFNSTPLSTSGISWGGNDGASCPLSNGLVDDEDCCAKILEILEGLDINSPTNNDYSSLREEVDALKAEISPNEEQKAILYQNAPNPFNIQTKINYEILDREVNKASMLIFDLNGNLKLTYPLEVQENGVLIIEGNSLSSGMYVYTLVIDNVAINSKKMILLDK